MCPAMHTIKSVAGVLASSIVCPKHLGDHACNNGANVARLLLILTAAFLGQPTHSNIHIPLEQTILVTEPGLLW